MKIRARPPPFVQNISSNLSAAKSDKLLAGIKSKWEQNGKRREEEILQERWKKTEPEEDNNFRSADLPQIQSNAVTAPIVWILGQPKPLPGGFPPLLAKNLGTIALAWVTARIRLEPLFAAETFFPAMLGLHSAFLTTKSWNSPWM